MARHFEVVQVSPPGEEEALRVVSGAKDQLESFHRVAVGEGTIQAALAASRRFLMGRQLPDRVIDLLDEAGARIKMRRESEPAEVIALRQRIRRITREMESAVANEGLTKPASGRRRKRRNGKASPAFGRSSRVRRPTEIPSRPRTLGRLSLSTPARRWQLFGKW